MEYKYDINPNLWNEVNGQNPGVKIFRKALNYEKIKLILWGMWINTSFNKPLLQWESVLNWGLYVNKFPSYYMFQA